MTPFERVLQRIRLFCLVDDDGCWRWHGCKGTDGQPRIWHLGRARPARRVALWAKLIGRLPSDRYAFNECGNRDCVNPDCLKAVTRSEYAKESEQRRPDIGVRRLVARRRLSKLQAHQVRLIQQRLAQGDLVAHVARDVGVTPTMVSRIKNGKAWRRLSPFGL